MAEQVRTHRLFVLQQAADPFSDRKGLSEAAPFPKRQITRYEGIFCLSESQVSCTSRSKGGKTTKDKRWYKDIGLGFKTPAEAIHDTYIGMAGVQCRLNKSDIRQTRSAHSPAMFPFGVVF